MIISNVSAGNLQVDGVYIDIVPAPPGLPAGPATGLVAIVGGANYGAINQPVGFVDGPSLAAAFGTDTVSAHALAREALTAMPEGTQFLGVRVADGTQAEATIQVVDASAGVVATLTADYTGSLPNGAASCSINLQSGTVSVSPSYSATLTFPQQPTQVFAPIIGYATAGDAYDAPTFKANFLAAINGTNANAAGSAQWTATMGASVLPPVVATPNLASGGVDGTTSITASTLIGTDGLTGRTGMYALRGLISAAQFILAAFTTSADGQTLVEFAQQENAIAHLTFPAGTSTATAIGLRATDDLADPSLILSIDWLNVYDVNSGQNLLVSPMGKIAGVIASFAAYQPVGNQPTPNGVVGVISTERIIGGINTVAQAEKAARQVNGLEYIGRMPSALNGPQLGLPHQITSAGLTSSGWSRISDSRMLKFIVDEVQQIEGPYVDGAMSVASSNLGQPTLGEVQDALETFLGNLLTGKPQQISDYDVLPQNTQAGVAAGQLVFSIPVTTLSSAQFIINYVQVGPTVQASVQTA